VVAIGSIAFFCPGRKVSSIYSRWIDSGGPVELYTTPEGGAFLISVVPAATDKREIRL
jgi:hypothetical protein